MKSRRKRVVRISLIWLFSLALGCLALGCTDEGSSDSEVAEFSDVTSDDGAAGDDGMAGNSGDEDTSCTSPDAIGDLTLLDVNPLSPTYNQERSFSELCGKVAIIFLTAFH